MNNHSSKFLQIHTLTSYPATLLNRDDLGYAKRIQFGGVSRTRISSQCLKRHWRRFEGEHSLLRIPKDPNTFYERAERSRLIFRRLLKDTLVECGFDHEESRAVSKAILKEVLNKEPKEPKPKKDEKADPDKILHTAQLLVIGRPEIDYFVEIAKEVLKQSKLEELGDAVSNIFKSKAAKTNLGVLLRGGIDSAMFGRMVTGNVLSQCDAALHVSHAFTVHAEEAEDDYFSAVDDLIKRDNETGSGHINSTELTSGLYYSYVVVDVPLLVSNLTGCTQADWHNADHELAQEIVRRMVHLIATVSPGAKLGSTAPYAYAHMVMVESGSEAPRTLANAFMNPVKADEGELLETTYKSLASYLKDLDQNYGKPSGGRRALALGSRADLQASLDEDVGFQPLADLATWAGKQVTA